MHLTCLLDLKPLGGHLANQVKQFDFPGRDFTLVFCTECGADLPFVTKNGKALIVPAGSLDAEPNITPNDNIFWAERASW
jgi:hypothetical protein